ncbi:hypothetical protein [Legionella sp. CNM-4043-24]|uniref:hypothetical protein n=1 Tax=Legionella sp. CNM-4043-24 TaxID=3421646 RepID=UPI00403AE916
MNHRLVWNFSIDDSNPLDISSFGEDEADSLRWEIRYFWADHGEIVLRGLDTECLNLTRFTVKHRPDAYYLLADKDYNIKQRRGEILIKPVMRQEDACLGYGKKINLFNYPAEQMLPGLNPLTGAQMMESVQSEGRIVNVDKCALIYKFDTQPGIKLELARLTIDSRIFFSACVEGRSLRLVNLISKHLLNQQISCDYVSFLKQIAVP